VAEYGRLKKQLAARFPTDIDRYIDGKTDFILKVLREMGLTDQLFTAISAINRFNA
jgi:GrpB protein